MSKPLWLGEMFTLVGYVARVNIQRALGVGGDMEDFKSAHLVPLHAPKVRTPGPKLKTPTRTTPCHTITMTMTHRVRMTMLSIPNELVMTNARVKENITFSLPIHGVQSKK